MKWLGERRRSRSTRRRGQPRGWSGVRRPVFELLEQRRVLAVFMVDNLDDAFVNDQGVAPGTLRQAIFDANNADPAEAHSIEFEEGLAGSIVLTQGELQITSNLTIAGPGASLLTIDAQQNSRIFNVDDGILDNQLDVEIMGMTLTGGSAFDGGAIRNDENLTVTASTISGNSVGFFGGGIYNRIGNLTVIASTISGNSAGDFGGGIYNSGNLAVTDSTISGNSAEFGGGIRSTTDLTGTRTTTITGSTISGNTAISRGGGVENYGGLTVIRHSTITDNSAPDGAGIGVVSFGEGFARMEVYSTIIAGNANSDVDGTDVNSFQSDGYNLIGTGNALAAFTNNDLTDFADPLLGPLANNGGPTLTHALLSGSPAIDAGDPDFEPSSSDPDGPALASFSFDQRGDPFARVFGGRIDIGAYERQTVAGLSLIVDSLVDENDGDYSPGNLSLREAIGLANGSVGPDTITFTPELTAAGAEKISLILGELQISESVTIEGPGANLLTIDAQGNSRIFNITATTGDFAISGLGLTGGRTTGDNGGGFVNTYSGGALRSLTTGNLTLTDVAVSGNHTTGERAHGGGLFSLGNFTITNSIISGNHTEGLQASGGGIYSRGDFTITDSTISGNHTRGLQADGGGISAVSYYGNITITDSTISGNHTEGNQAGGGGVDAFAYGNITITDSIISGNYTTGDDADGGGIFAFAYEQIALTNSTLSGNHTEGTRSHGGGIFAFAYGEVALANSTVSGNSTAGSSAHAGGIYVARNGGGGVASGDVTIVDSSINDNSTAGDGGGLSARSVTLTNSTVSGNIAASVGASRGGGIIADDLTLNRSTVSGNRTDGFQTRGGGIAALRQVNISDSTIHDNHAQGTGGSRGGGLFLVTDSASSRITNSTISGNTATEDGGGVFSYLLDASLSLTISHSTISGNTSGDLGGGIHHREGQLVIESSTISGNAATGDGGGIWIADSATGRIQFSTIANNETGGSGGGIWTAAPVELDHTIVGRNFFAVGGDDFALVGQEDDIAGTATARFSLIGSDFGATITDEGGNLIGQRFEEIDPLLDPLGDNGGSTQTHRLRPGSPAINAGDRNIDAPPEFDQRGEGFPRVVYGRIDMGAVEFDDPIPLNLVVDHDVDEFDGDFSLGNLSLREAIWASNVDPAVQTITFAPELTAAGQATIFLTLGALRISDSVTIEGPGANRLTIDAQQESRVFTIDSGDDSDDDDDAPASIDVTLRGLTMANGRAGSIGGAIYSRENTTIAFSMIVDSSAGGGGGGIFHERGTLTIDSSTITGNSADEGGGIFSNTELDVAAIITNSTISDNTADSLGGGVFNHDGLMVIEFSTITNNLAPEFGGSGVASYADDQTLTRVHSSIIVGNVNGDVRFVEDFSEEEHNSFESLGYNLIGTGNALAAFNQPGDQTGVAEPLLGPLADNGGRTLTHALLPGSPAIDAGDPFAFPGDGAPMSDQRGAAFTRVSNGRIDIGAFEFEFEDDSFPDASLTGDGDFGGVFEGDTEQRTFTLESIGTADLVIFSAGITGDPVFTIDGDFPGALPPGESFTFVVNLDTSSTGDFAGTLFIETDGGFFNVPLSATVEAQFFGPDAFLDGDGGFGRVFEGDTEQRQFTLESTGDADLVIVSAGITGDPVFTIDRDFPGALPPGESFTFVVNLDTSSTGDFAGTLFIETDGGFFNVPLSATVEAVSEPVMLEIFVPGPQEIDEGNEIDLASLVTFVPGTLRATYAATVDWGDGSPEEPLEAFVDELLVGRFERRPHTYADDGVYLVKITLIERPNIDSFETSDEKQFIITVNNVAPTLLLVGNQTVNEGGLLSLPNIGLVTDPGFDNPDNPNGPSRETFAYTVDWGDGTAVDSGAVTIDAVGSPEALTRGSFDGSHIYADDGLYLVTVTVTDDDGGVAVGTFQVTVNNVAPTLVVVGNQTVNEGALLSLPNLGLVTDPGFDNPANPNGPSQETFTYTVDWGDGTAIDSGVVRIDVAGSPGALTRGSFDGSHVYADNGVFTVVVTIDDGFDQVQDSFTVTVNNVLPTLTVPGPQTGREGSELTITGRITDPGFRNEELETDETFRFWINWGDGTPPDVGDAAIFVGGSPGVRTQAAFGGAHIYADNGVFTVTVRVADDDMTGNFTGGVNGIDYVQQTFTVIVANIAPTVTIFVTPSNINEGQSVTLTGTYFDPGVDDTHVLIINWGDGTVSDPLPVTGGALSFTHTYGNNPPGTPTGPYLIEVTIVDKDGGVGDDSTAVIVANVAPMLTLSGSPTGREGSELAITGRITDPGFPTPKGETGETFRFWISWGDGTPPDEGTATIDIVGEPGVLTQASFAGVHTYLDNGVYTITVRVADDDMSGNFTDGDDGIDYVERTFTVTIENEPPFFDNIFVTPSNIDEGQSVTLTGTYSDPGVLDTHVLIIDWGDRSPLQTVSVAGGDFSVPHEYLDNPDGTPIGPYPIRVTIIDKDGGEGVAFAEVIVANVPPELRDLIAEADTLGFATLSGRIVDPGTLDSFTLVVNWGDGTVDTFIYPEGTMTFVVVHRYLSPGDFRIDVTLSDDDGGTTSETVTLSIVLPFVVIITSLPEPSIEQGPPDLLELPKIPPLFVVARFEFPVSDGGSGGQELEPSKIPDEPNLRPDHRRLLDALSDPRIPSPEEVIDAVYSLADFGLISLVGFDMGDEPLPRKKKQDAEEEKEAEPAQPFVVEKPPERDSEPERRWGPLALLSALAGGGTLWFGGAWWWRGRRRRHTPV